MYRDPTRTRHAPHWKREEQNTCFKNKTPKNPGFYVKVHTSSALKTIMPSLTWKQGASHSNLFDFKRRQNWDIKL